MFAAQQRASRVGLVYHPPAFDVAVAAAATVHVPLVDLYPLVGAAMEHAAAGGTVTVFDLEHLVRATMAAASRGPCLPYDPMMTVPVVPAGIVVAMAGG